MGISDAMLLFILVLLLKIITTVLCVVFVVL